MTALRSLTLSNWRFACNDKILKLSMLQHLSEVSFAQKQAFLGRGRFKSHKLQSVGASSEHLVS